MKIRLKQYFIPLLAALLGLVIAGGSGFMIYRTLEDIHRREAGNILHFYEKNILLQTRGTLNEADTLSRAAEIMKEDSAAWFGEAAGKLLEKDEVRFAGLIKGDTMVSAFPKETYGFMEGKDLKDFSYIYTLAKVVKEVVVEGPVDMISEAGPEAVFLFLQPYLEENAYLGEVVVALDRDYVLGQLGFDELSVQGYDYELWRVEPQNGAKEVVACSREGMDFSHAEKTSFYLPTQWNLSIQPTEGWISQAYLMGIILFCTVFFFFVLGLAYTLHKLHVQSRVIGELACKDADTGLFNREGFTETLDAWTGEGGGPVILFYFVFEGYNQVTQLIGREEENAFLKSIPLRLREFIKSPYIAGRLGAGNFMVAVREDMNPQQQEAFAKGLSLELILKIRLEGKRNFLSMRYQYRLCGPDSSAKEEINGIIHAYYQRVSEESPAHRMTEKCRQLIEGNSDVVFDEYTDPEMLKLSRTINEYRKQVEQLVYYDPVFHVGNRLKYLKDANMLISYDKKRPFKLFIVDVCRFSQYNELFSAEVGDQILHELLNRLWRPFGTHLYRINGDVFLGISLSDEKADLLGERLQRILTTPVSAGTASLSPQVRIAACSYPDNGAVPGVLLDRIQSALRVAKESDQKLVVYNDELAKQLETETEILYNLEAGIREQTLEVWYQPLMHIASGRYTSVEALIRLPDGKGGYYSASQVISLAERNNQVEQLGDYVLQKACRFMVAYGKELGLDRMGINLSVQQLLVEDSASHLKRMIRESGVDAGQITLEITESVLIQSIEQASDTLGELRDAGVHIALDDFGVGYSSLNYLSNLPVDVIKIDRSLTQQILTNQKQYVLLHGIVEVAAVNALKVVVEGVETESEQQMISVSGVEYIQGFYYASPMQTEQLIRFLKENKR